MITNVVGTDDHKLLQESILTARQPCMAPVMSYIYFDKYRRPGDWRITVVNLMG